MAGGKHKNHGHLMTGLEPDTEYHYRIDAIDVEGTVYRSPDFTFRTAPASDEAVVTQRPSGDNLALSSSGTRVVGTSSVFDAGDDDGPFGGQNAIDGDQGTQWVSEGDGDSAWVEIELPTRTNITSIGLQTWAEGTGAQILSFRVLDDDGQGYRPFELNDPGTVNYFDTNLTATRIRFEAVTTSAGNTGVIEIEVYGQLSMGQMP